MQVTVISLEEHLGMIPLRGENCGNRPGYLRGFEAPSIMRPAASYYRNIEVMQVTVISLEKHLGMIPLRGENCGSRPGYLRGLKGLSIMRPRTNKICELCSTGAILTLDNL